METTAVHFEKRVACNKNSLLLFHNSLLRKLAEMKAQRMPVSKILHLYQVNQ